MTELDGELARRRADLAIVAGFAGFLKRRADYYSSWAEVLRQEYKERLVGELDWVLGKRRQRICYSLNDHIQNGSEGDAEFGLYKSEGSVGLFQILQEQINDQVGDFRSVMEGDDRKIVTVDLSQTRLKQTIKARFFCPDHLSGRLMPGRNSHSDFTAPIEDREGVLLVVPEGAKPFEPQNGVLTMPEYPVQLYKYLGLVE